MFRKIPLILFLTMTACTILAACAGSQKKAALEKQIDTDYQMAVNFYQNDKTPEAIRQLALVLAANPEHAEANHLMGFIRLGRGQYEEAVRHFKRALKTKPDMLECQNNLGVAYMHLEQYEDAAIIFKELTKSPLYTSPWLAFVNLGWAYYQMGMLPEAIDETEMAVDLGPKLCLGYNNLGIFYREQKRDDKARKNLEEAIRICPNYAEPHIHLAHIFEAEGDRPKAFAHFSKCAELSPKTELGQRCKQLADLMR
ncbi:MAG: tetratricopeptide repeat protein [Proteobacteria bacterium]|nr:tetratricopeptide repeat protein [Pseudomonadota bacterium]